jgi:hypothetical protein
MSRGSKTDLLKLIGRRLLVDAAIGKMRLEKPEGLQQHYNHDYFTYFSPSSVNNTKRIVYNL